MKIGIVSDTHGCSSTWKKLYNNFFSDVDLIIHAGDVLYHGPRNNIPSEYNPKELAELLNSCPTPIIAACGNCDAEVDSMVLDIPIQAPYAYMHLQNLRIIVTHGHNLTEERKKTLATKYKVNLFITGHTHIATLDKYKSTIFLNPGSPVMTKRLDKRNTIAILSDEKITVFDVNTKEELISELLNH
ncbi:Phosphodiesterase YfcE [bioreactor metagenome]|uniref:Phosphodiesterase YfcE n=1 Tax=bioreactor metagenome TaxID=1076179 RepID=A0A644T0T3_9ZZZZ|nr:phosphodiesterase [Negativicutes bacterium]